MSRRLQSLWVVWTSLMVALTGCHPTQPSYFFEDGDLSHYLDKATQIDYPDAQTTTLAEVENALPPLTLENATPQDFWALSLEEAVRTAMDNSKVMRSLGGRYSSSAFQSRAQTGEAPDAILTAPDNSRSVYDPALVETTPFVGTEYALSAFDAQVTSSMFWQHNDRPQNVKAGQFGGFFVPTFEENNSTFNAQIAKTNATGGTLSLSNNTFYDQTNNPTWQVPSTYAVTYQAGFSQPLLQGSGVNYNRIAGPFNPFTPTASGLNTPGFDGVLLARINTDISLADFEGGVRNLVYDVENAYWELYFAYRALEASKTGRASALTAWKKIHALFVVGSRGGEAEKEAQARAQYFLFRAQVQTSLNDLFRAENRLRYVIGLSVSDGRLIRPADEPTTAKVTFDWRDIHAEALGRSPELRRQKWRIKERELEIIAAKSNLQPRLDASGNYQFYGLGDQLISSNRARLPINPSVPLFGTNAYQSLTSGNFQSWQLGLNFQMTLGFRAALSTIRHYQLQLAKERSRLQDEELEVSHEVGDALRNLEYNYNLSQTNFNRRVAAERQVEAVQAAFDAETVTLDLLLDAQRQRADAEVTYFRTLVDYQRGIAQVHYRKGSLLEYDGVYLSEGPWPAKAKFDALRQARARDASYYLDYGFTRPKVISRGAYLQNTQGADQPYDGSAVSEGEETLPDSGTEQIGTPTPAASAAVVRKPVSLVTRMPTETGKTLATTAAEPNETSRPVALNSIRDQDNGSDTTLRIVGTDRSSTMPVTIRDERVHPAAYGQWQSSGDNETGADSTTGAAHRAAAGWQRAKRQ